MCVCVRLFAFYNFVQPLTITFNKRYNYTSIFVRLCAALWRNKNYLIPLRVCCASSPFSPLSIPSCRQPEMKGRNHGVQDWGIGGQGQSREAGQATWPRVIRARLLNRPARAGNNLINACRTSIVAVEAAAGETRAPWEGIRWITTGRRAGTAGGHSAERAAQSMPSLAIAWRRRTARHGDDTIDRPTTTSAASIANKNPPRKTAVRFSRHAKPK